MQRRLVADCHEWLAGPTRVTVQHAGEVSGYQ